MFSISVLPQSAYGPEIERVGRIRIGDFEENFACCNLARVGVDEFPTIWRENLEKLLEGEYCVALVHDPRFAWVVYREGDSCYVQQHFFIEGEFDTIRPRETVNEDGDQISEWSVGFSAISDFLGATEPHQ